MDDDWMLRNPERQSTSMHAAFRTMSAPFTKSRTFMTLALRTAALAPVCRDRAILRHAAVSDPDGKATPDLALAPMLCLPAKRRPLEVLPMHIRQPGGSLVAR